MGAVQSKPIHSDYWSMLGLLDSDEGTSQSETSSDIGSPRILPSAERESVDDIDGILEPLSLRDHDSFDLDAPPQDRGPARTILTSPRLFHNIECPAPQTKAPGLAGRKRNYEQQRYYAQEAYDVDLGHYYNHGLPYDEILSKDQRPNKRTKPSPTPNPELQLQNIATELIQGIAGFVSFNDLAALRATCRALNAKTWFVVGPQFFSTQTTSLIEPGGGKLREIADNPKIRHLVQTIHIQDPLVSCFDAFRSDTGPSCIVRSVTRKDQPRFWRRAKDWSVDISKSDMSWLKDCFAQRTLQPKSIVIRDGTFFSNIGTKNVANLAWHLACRSPLHAISVVVRSHPLTRSVEAVVSLDLTIPKHQSHWKPTECFRKSHSWRRIRSLSLEQSRQSNEGCMKAIVPAACDLKELEIRQSVNKGSLSNHLRLTWATPITARLTTLKLGRVYIEPLDFLFAFDASRSSLQRLSIWEVRMSPESSWRSMLLQIAQAFSSLEQWSLRSLFAEVNFDIFNIRFFPLRDHQWLVPAQFQASLTLLEGGVFGLNMANIWADYEGAGACQVLSVLAENLGRP